MHLTVSETQLLSKALLMREEIVLGLFRLSSLIEHELNLALHIQPMTSEVELKEEKNEEHLRDPLGSRLSMGPR